ncbi:unnamed protein product [Aphanomyces euteiches]|uniref:Lipase-like C-terminal domain-containing protein n=1 Tax=Aphanomyces euteiches TaxID=100861 RepID=A0A6G0WRC2_9STRA|nr:hypothetical protein Ae201684_012605 [Aphanomyces euteiches]KAH9090574.1 hypothetical protein Ae201684P_014372 [Aphanomyces euteiches]KAH9141765.1 hypothetical protein AeRB84_014092 [Aphanomyces euteiches]
MERTKDPAVFVHGFLEWGLNTPLFGLAPSFWPTQALEEINSNHIILDVGRTTSDHDRATEVFYQLVGGQVDYGEEHARRHGHARFGQTYPKEKAFYPQWSEDHPIHLVGHSFGSTTAIELYQMICNDAFGVGSNFKWVKSITSISGPLTGSTFCNLMGAKYDSGVPFLSPGHLLVGFLSFAWKLQMTWMPWLKRVYDFQMDHWKDAVPWSTVLSTQSPFHTSKDMVLYDLLPSRRLERNGKLVHMDKIYLLSIVATPKDPLVIPTAEWSLAALALWFLYRRKSIVQQRSLRFALSAVVVLLVLRKVPVTDYSKIRMSFWGLTWLIGRHTKSIPSHEVYAGFDGNKWELNDGVVNTYSQIRPRAEESMKRIDSCVSHMSIDLKMAQDDAVVMEKGQWHTYRVDKNHLSGTTWDKEAGELYKNLFKLLNNLSKENQPMCY